MNKIKLLLGGISAVALVLVGSIGVANAHSFRAGNNVLVGGNAISETLFATGNSVNISAEVFGDIFCAGQNITVTGKVHGDVICAGQVVNVAGTVDGDVRLAGQSITVSGDVKGNATFAGQSVALDSSSHVGGDVTIGSADSVLNGTIDRDLTAGGESVVIAGTVGRNVNGSIANLELASQAKVGGNIDFTSTSDVVKSGNAVVGGTITRSDPPRETEASVGSGAFFLWVAYLFVAMLLAAFVLALLFPQLLHGVTEQALPTPWIALLTGFLANLAMPAVIVLLGLTVVGIPLAVILGLAWVVVLLLSGPVLGYYLGRLLLRDSRQPLVIMLAGASPLFLVYFIPLLGALAMLAALWLGSGMILLKLFRATPRPAYALAAASQPAKPAARRAKK